MSVTVRAFKRRGSAPDESAKVGVKSGGHLVSLGDSFVTGVRLYHEKKRKYVDSGNDPDTYRRHVMREGRELMQRINERRSTKKA